MPQENVRCSNNGDLFYTNPSESIIRLSSLCRSTQLYHFLGAMKEFFQVELGSVVDGYLGVSGQYRVVDKADRESNGLHHPRRRKNS